MTVEKSSAAAVFQAMQLAKTIEKRLERGWVYFNPRTKRPLRTVEEVLKCIDKEGSVIQKGEE